MKKTKITTTSEDQIKTGLNNKYGMVIENTPEIRKAVASEVHNILRKIQGK